jgi:uncharacterized protein (DUF1800 family)
MRNFFRAEVFVLSDFVRILPASKHAMPPPLKPWSPSRTEPWDSARAAHLFNRAGFGGTPEERDALTKRSVADAIDRFVRYEQFPDPTPPPDWAKPLNLTPEERKNLTPEQRKELQKQQRQHIEDLKLWWLRRMVVTPRPLQEKMTLFWHSHFATGAEKVKSAYLMFLQNETLRAHATGNFRDLVLAMCRDPAMCHYLDSNTNRREHPNENFARELMELFTMGEGNYSEDDVKESARAFTGWGVQGEQFKFRPRQHDGGPKTFLGRTGNFDGADIVNIILEQPVTARFICHKLWEFFAYENPEPDLLEDLANIFRRSNYELEPVLAALLASEAFWSAKAMRAQIKSPVQLVVGSLRLLNAEVKAPRLLTASLRLMGQDLFFPPTVKGWDGGQAWINTSTLLVRYNFANAIVNGILPEQAMKLRKGEDKLPPRLTVTASVDKLLPASEKLLPEQLVDRLADALLQTKLLDAQRKELVEFAAKGTGAANAPVDWRAPDALRKVRALINLIMSSAAYQVC